MDGMGISEVQECLLNSDYELVFSIVYSQHIYYIYTFSCYIYEKYLFR
jgi:hypothetical protein